MIIGRSEPYGNVLRGSGSIARGKCGGYQGCLPARSDALDPDRNGGSKASTERFKLIAEAYQILADGARRKQYDEDLDKGASQTAHESVDEEAAERIFWNEMIKLAFAFRRKGIKQEMIERELIRRGCPGGLAAALAAAAYAHGQDAQAKSASSSRSAPREQADQNPASYDIKQYYSAAIGKFKLRYYLQRFALFDGSTRTRYDGGNLGAFLFGPWWLLYRKMYLFGAAILGLDFLVLPMVAETGDLMGAVVGLAYLSQWFLLTLFGNYIYYRHIQRKIRDALAIHTKDNQVWNHLASKSGAHTVIANVAILVPLIGILAAIAIPAYDDYTKRASTAQSIAVNHKQITSALSIAERYKQAIIDYVKETGYVPVDNDDIGIAPNAFSFESNIAETRVIDGVVRVTFASGDLQDEALYLSPHETEDGRIIWHCTAGFINDKYLPQACRTHSSSRSWENVNSDEWHARAQRLFDRSDWRGLLELCKQWVAENPDNPQAWDDLGVAYDELGRYGKAIKAFRHAYQLDFGYESAIDNLAITYDKLRRIGEQTRSAPAQDGLPSAEPQRGTEQVKPVVPNASLDRQLKAIRSV